MSGPDLELWDARQGDTVQRRRARRKISAVGRAWQLGLASVAGVDLVDVYDNKVPGIHVPPGVVIVVVWGGQPREVEAMVERQAEIDGLLAIPICRPSTRGARVRAWWRYVLDCLPGGQWWRK